VEGAAVRGGAAAAASSVATTEAGSGIRIVVPAVRKEGSSCGFVVGGFIRVMWKIRRSIQDEDERPPQKKDSK